MTSTRNRSPESMAQHHETEETKKFREMVRINVAQGMDPLEVGSIVLDAIQNDRFWIFTHEHVAKIALRQTEVMASEQKLIDLA